MPASSPDLGTAVRDAAQGKRLLVLDYDGTLAYLAIDWPSVRHDLSNVAGAHGFKSEFRPLWDEIARFRDLRGPEMLPLIFRVLRRHEEIGLDGQRPRADVVEAARFAAADTGAGTVVLSLNLRATVESGLAAVGLRSVSAIVGADDVEHWKPDPEGLNLLLVRAGVEPGQALLVGDSHRDAGAAAAAGVDFFRV